MKSEADLAAERGYKLGVNAGRKLAAEAVQSASHLPGGIIAVDRAAVLARGETEVEHVSYLVVKLIAKASSAEIAGRRAGAIRRAVHKACDDFDVEHADVILKTDAALARATIAEAFARVDAIFEETMGVLKRRGLRGLGSGGYSSDEHSGGTQNSAAGES